MLEDYHIEFVKLKLGKHVFNLKADSSFFQSLENQDVLNADVNVQIEIEKHPTWMNVSFTTAGVIYINCDRCSVELPYPVNSQYQILYKNAVDETQEDEEAVRYLHPSDYKIDLSIPVYETILLSLPMIKNCDNLDEPPCDDEMLDKLEQNETTPEDEQYEDPRWEKLKKLK